jgi:hypothetical protein
MFFVLIAQRGVSHTPELLNSYWMAQLEIRFDLYVIKLST